MTDHSPIESLTVEVDPDASPGAAVVSAKGELDVFTVPLIRDALDALPLDSLDVVVADLAGLTFIDSSGLGALMATQKKLRAHGGDLRLVCGQGPVLRLLDVTGLLAVISVNDTVEEALGTDR